jgi:hypothetical protein
LAKLSEGFAGAAGFYFASTVSVGLDDLANFSGILRDAAAGKGNFSIGSASAVEYAYDEDRQIDACARARRAL